jgi:hypothetical protein
VATVLLIVGVLIVDAINHANGPLTDAAKARVNHAKPVALAAFIWALIYDISQMVK